MSDRIAVMEAGRILQVADPKTLYEHPNARAVADFIGTANFLSGRVIASTGERTTVETALGPMELSHGGNLAPGAEVTVAIRPEKLALSRDTGPPAGRIAAVSYLGDRSQFQVSIDGATLIATAQAGATFRIGETVHLGWAADSIMLFPA